MSKKAADLQTIKIERAVHEQARKHYAARGFRTLYAFYRFAVGQALHAKTPAQAPEFDGELDDLRRMMDEDAN